MFLLDIPVEPRPEVPSELTPANINPIVIAIAVAVVLIIGILIFKKRK